MLLVTNKCLLLCNALFLKICFSVVFCVLFQKDILILCYFSVRLVLFIETYDYYYDYY